MSKKRILLVEDNADDVELTLRALRTHHAEAEVVVARDGAEALDLLFGPGQAFARVLPALVLLDLNLPKVTGLEVLRRIRSEARTLELPVVIMTTSREERDIVEGYKLGANSYVRKPVKFEDFEQAVRFLGLYWLVLNQPGKV
jgi:two-component system response regulator